MSERILEVFTPVGLVLTLYKGERVDVICLDDAYEITIFPNTQMIIKHHDITVEKKEKKVKIIKFEDFELIKITAY